MPKPAIKTLLKNKNSSTGLYGARNAIEEWFMEHLGFISIEEYQLRGVCLGEWANKTRLLQKEVERLQELLDGRKHE